ncbi:MAG TPA: rRNA (guanine-N2)-methyltransferase, partial [Rectinemataceae bacterium]|nr:rRNA (guanine-N2)-methyltransferase [Rectinemataceae bacterium]
SVDLSNTYLGWAARNLALNGLEDATRVFVKSDVKAFLEDARRRGHSWDLIVCDPPTFSNSSSTESDFDVNKDWPNLIASCLGVLSPGASLYFSSNSRRLRWDASLVAGMVEDISDSSLPPDFRDRRTRRTWKILKPS